MNLTIPNPPAVPVSELEAALGDPAFRQVQAGDNRTMGERVVAYWNASVDEHPAEFVVARSVLRPGRYGGGGHSSDWRADWNTLWPGRTPAVCEWIAWTCHHKVGEGEGAQWYGDPAWRGLAFKARLMAAPPFFPTKPALAGYSDSARNEWWTALHDRIVEVGLVPPFSLFDIDREFPEPGRRYPARDIAAWAAAVRHPKTWAASRVTLVTPDGADGALLSQEEAKELAPGTLVRGPFDFFGTRGTVAHVPGAEFGDLYP